MPSGAATAQRNNTGLRRMLQTLQRQKSPLAEASNQLRILATRPAGGVASFADALRKVDECPLRAAGIEVLQLNLGKVCNQTCAHCHVDAGPERRDPEQVAEGDVTARQGRRVHRVEDAVPDQPAHDREGRFERPRLHRRGDQQARREERDVGHPAERALGRRIDVPAEPDTHRGGTVGKHEREQVPIAAAEVEHPLAARGHLR